MARHYDVYVPDEGPENADILLVGEAPGADEHEQRRPFIGKSGDILTNVLERNGRPRHTVRLANLCHYRPYDNKFENLMGTEALERGVNELYAWIAAHRPTVIVPLGKWPTAFLTGKKGILVWRGSILGYVNDDTIKTIPTVHPAAVLRDRGLYPVFDMDMKRIVADAKFPEKRLPKRDYIVDPRGLELEEWTQRLCEAEFLGTDIETIKKTTHILCVGFALSPILGVCITPHHEPGRQAIQRILLSKAKKIFQFGTFDVTQLLELNGFQMSDPDAEALRRPYYWDTMVAQHVMEPELPRSLGYLTSIYTREPYYKHSGKDAIPGDEKGWSAKTNRDELYVYNAKDCCVTIETALQQMEEIDEEELWVRRMDFEMSQLVVAHHIGSAGMYRDEERRVLLEKVLLSKWNTKQFLLDQLTGFKTNVKSPKLLKILYDKDKMNLPARYTREGKMTADEDAIVGLIQHCKSKIDKLVRKDAILDWQCKLAVCQTILEIRGIRQMLSNYIRAKASDDGRVRSTYKVAGTETGRWSSSAYSDGTGYNAQTNPRDPVEVPDEYFEEKSDLTNDEGSVRLLEELDEEESQEDNDEEEAA